MAWPKTARAAARPRAGGTRMRVHDRGPRPRNLAGGAASSGRHPAATASSRPSTPWGRHSVPTPQTPRKNAPHWTHNGAVCPSGRRSTCPRHTGRKEAGGGGSGGAGASPPRRGRANECRHLHISSRATEAPASPTATGMGHVACHVRSRIDSWYNTTRDRTTLRPKPTFATPSAECRANGVQHLQNRRG